ncbi:hypothetical protein AX16_009347, partial [Volvariella volvacea WC 439]
RTHRKFMHQTFNSSAIIKFNLYIMKSVYTLIRNLLRKPEDFWNHIPHMTAEVILLTAYGIQVLQEADPYIKLPVTAMRELSEAMISGQYLTDSLPWMKYIPEWMPFAEFQRMAARCRKYTMDMVEVPYQVVKETMLTGMMNRSVISDSLKAAGDGISQEQEDTIKQVASILFSAASDMVKTNSEHERNGLSLNNQTVSVILNRIMGLMCYPEVLVKAQDEIDAIIKPGHLPNFGDCESMPYFSAVVKEAIRWYPVVPLCVPHFNETNNIYKGYWILKGSIISPNL